MARNPRADQIGMGGRMLSVQVGGSSRNAQVRIPGYPAGHSDDIRPPKPGYPGTLV